jgi:hypothetical protein
MQTQPDIFYHLTATGWTAIGSIVGALSIIALSVFNVLTLGAAFRAARAAESQAGVAQTSLELLRNQLDLTQRPFVAIHSEYWEDIGACLVYAHNQGNGPALDVEATLEIDDDDPLRVHEFSIGCLAVDEQFQFLIGDRSKNLTAATIQYKSISDQEWTTKIELISGSPVITTVTKGHQDDGKHRRLQNVLMRAAQTEEG